MPNDSLKILLWIFLSVLYIFVTFALYLKSGRNGNGLPISKRKELWWQNLILNSLFCLPLPILFAYKSYGDTLNTEILFFILLPIVVFALCYEFLYSQPRINQLATEADNLFKTLKLDVSEKNIVLMRKMFGYLFTMMLRLAVITAVLTIYRLIGCVKIVLVNTFGLEQS